MFHYRRQHKIYRSYPKPKTCHFCDERHISSIVKHTKLSLVIKNRTFYDLWELRPVTDHLMVIPRRHVHTLKEMTTAERLDIMELIAEYEAQGYNVYARGAHSKQRSVHHQHTHLIKTEDKQGRVSLFIKRPYFLIKF
jgi:diadenosine tetraphosphate (Ap4A) HIT family hydrolase